MLCCALVFVPLGKTAASAAAADDTIAETYTGYLTETGVAGAPTVICDVRTQEDLISLAGDVTPSNAILRIDGDCNVVTETGEALGSFDEIYTKTLRGKIIPVLFLSDRAGADAAMQYLKEERAILDIAVMSEDASLVKSVRTELPRIRGIVSFPQKTDPFEVVKTVNSSYANVAVLRRELTTKEDVDFIQSRFKTVWLLADEDGPMPYHSAIVSGAFGVIAQKYAKVYEVLTGAFPAGEVYRMRMPYNVAHRGMGTSGQGANLLDEYHENSVSSCQKAVEAGATHLEVDAYVTTDDVIVMMHDNDLSRTTDGTGHIENYSYSQLMEFDLDLAPRTEKIPTLSQILDISRETGVIVVLEIKTEKTDKFLAAFRDTVEQKSARDGFDYWRQIVVISFQVPVITAMRVQLPEVPTADLNSVDVGNGPLLFKLSEWNTGVDAPAGEATYERENFLRARGIVGWYWTYGSFLPLQYTQGVTNNDPRAEGVIRRVYTEDFELQEGQRLYSGVTVAVKVEDYAGNVTEDEGEVVFFQKTENGYAAIVRYETEQGAFFTDLFYATEKSDEPQEPAGPQDPAEPSQTSPAEGGGCGAALGISPLLLCAPFLFFVRRKRA